MIYTTIKNRTPHDNEIWQCDNCGQIFIGILASKCKTDYEPFYKTKKEPIISSNPYKSACECCVEVRKIGECDDIIQTP